MLNKLSHDISSYPDAFWIKNPLDAASIERAQQLWNPPADLISLWKEFGTGEMFESEVILRPFAESRSVEFFTEREKKKGMPRNLTSFHYGIFSSAFDQESFFVFDRDSYERLGHFRSLDDWYVEFIKKSWGARYGISG